MRRPVAHRGQWILISFLDLITCGLGASVLLMLITAIARQTDPPLADDGTVVIQGICRSPSAAEVGLQFRAAGELEWKPVERLASHASSILRPGTPATGNLLVYALLPELAPGEYEFRAFVRDAPGGAFDDTIAADLRGPVTRTPEPFQVELQALGQRVSFRREGSDDPSLQSPGDIGATCRVSVRVR